MTDVNVDFGKVVNMTDTGTFVAGQPISESAAPPDHLTQQVAIIARWRRILSVRWLIFIALTGALAVWGYSTIDPTPWRFGVSVGYSVLVLMPTFWLYAIRSE